jgi:AmmeMemoRadiSam system protein B/AmmeMemoRadiSam system protein A
LRYCRRRWLRVGLAGALGICWIGVAAPGHAAEAQQDRPLLSGQPDEPRAPTVAGRFYPADPAALRAQVEELLHRQPEPAAAAKPRLLIVPHAGYPYSGSIAAAGFRAVQGRRYDGVVVVGFTHRLQFDGSSVDRRTAYATPLGELSVDQEAAALLRGSSGITFVEQAHAMDEHSLEVQLPFLQVALGPVRVVPILMGSRRLRDAQQLAEALAVLAQRGDYLFVFSTDLSHDHPALKAEAVDQATVNAILFETPQAMSRLFDAGQLEACGQGPILAGLALAARLGYPRRQLLAYAHSGDATGDPSSVVGYAAVAMSARGAEIPNAPSLSPEAGAALVRAARQTLERSLHPVPVVAPVEAAAGAEATAVEWNDAAAAHEQATVDSADAAAEPADAAMERPGATAERADAPAPKEQPPDIAQELLAQYPELARASGLFVTLRRQDGELRGCVGRVVSDDPLGEAVSTVALDAALRDARFSPVAPEELPELAVEVSVLTSPVRLERLTDLVAGRDGVILEHHGRHGVFLPTVWEHTGWTRFEFLRELASQKAGLEPDAWQDAALYVFQDQTFAEPASVEPPAH